MKALSFQGPLSLNQASGAAPSTVFRSSAPLDLRFSLGSTNESISLDQSQTKLEAQFSLYDYDALALGAGDPLAATLSQIPDSNLVLVTLSAPRHLLRIDTQFLRPQRVAVSGSHVFERRALASEEQGFVDEAFVPDTLSIFRFDGQPADKPSVTGFDGIEFADEFTDARFAIQLGTPFGGAIALAPSDIRHLVFRSYPTGPRLGIASGSAKTVFFWRAPGEIRPGAPNDPAHVQNAEAPFTQQLQSAVDTLVAKLAPSESPQTLSLELVVEADAPCQLTISDFEVAYHRKQQTFADTPSDKRVVKLPNDAASGAQMLLSLPSGVQVVSATIAVDASSAPRAAASADPLTSAPNSTQGALLEAGYSVARSIALNAPERVLGVALGLLPLTSILKLVVSLKEDVSGQPAGRTLANGTLELSATATPRWSALSFAAACALQAQKYWLVVTAASGLAVWLGRAGGGDAPLRTPSAAQAGTLATALAAQELFLNLLPELSAANVSAWTLRVDQSEVAPSGSVSDSQTLDLTAGLNASLAGAHGSRVQVPLSVSSPLPGSLTLYAPIVLFDELPV